MASTEKMTEEGAVVQQHLLDLGTCIARVTGEEYIICKWDRLFAKSDGFLSFKNQEELMRYINNKVKGK